MTIGAATLAGMTRAPHASSEGDQAKNERAGVVVHSGPQNFRISAERHTTA
jgi:hypothetical protein